jgi:hypothetical protein
MHTTATGLVHICKHKNKIFKLYISILFLYPRFPDDPNVPSHPAAEGTAPVQNCCSKGFRAARPHAHIDFPQRLRGIKEHRHYSLEICIPSSGTLYS